MTDADLLLRFVKEKDDAAFARVVARHAAAVERVALLDVGSAGAPDVAQAALIVMARRPKPAMRSARRHGSAWPWLRKVAKYTAANYRKVEARRKKHERAAPERVARVDPSQSHELAEAVSVSLRTLGRRDRKLVTLRHLEDLPWSEVGRLTNSTAEAARKATERAMARLREALEKNGITASTAVVTAALGTLSSASMVSAAVATSASATPLSFELAKGTIMAMNLKLLSVTSAIGVSALIVGGVTAIAVTPVIAPPHPSTKAVKAQAVKAETSFKRNEDGSVRFRLPNGRAFDLVYMARHSPDGGIWSGDGTLLEKRPVPIEEFDDSLALLEVGLREVVDNDEDRGMSWSWEGILYKTNLPPQPKNVMEVWSGEGRDLFLQLVQPEVLADSFGLRVGMGGGDWREVFAWKPDGTEIADPQRSILGQGSAAAVMKYKRSPDEEEVVDTTTSVTAEGLEAFGDLGRWQWVAFAILKDGKRLRSEQPMHLKDNVAKTDAIFRRVTPEQIERFVLEVRPKHYVTVSGIPARPDAETSLKVKDEAPPTMRGGI